jgi:hypothetical protein
MMDFDVGSLCSWRADEVELVEFSPDVCRDPTMSVAMILGTWCGGRARSAPRSMMPGGGAIRTQGAGGGYVIIWEKQ